MSKDYLYFLYEFNGKQKDILKILDTGLEIGENTILKSFTMTQVSPDQDLETAIKLSAEKNDAVFVIKIPVKYMALVVHRDGSMDFPIPLLKEVHEPPSFTYYILPPNFIQGVYLTEANKSITNPKFSPLFNPNGLQYTREQIDNCLNHGKMEWVNIMRKRKSKPFNVLKINDEKNKTFDDIMQTYKNDLKK